MEKVRGKREEVRGVVVGHLILSRAGYGSPSDCEVSDLAKGRFHVGEHVAIAVKGDCGMKRSSYRLYEVAEIRPCNRWGGTRETVKFVRVKEGGAK